MPWAGKPCLVSNFHLVQRRGGCFLSRHSCDLGALGGDSREGAALEASTSVAPGPVLSLELPPGLPQGCRVPVTWSTLRAAVGTRICICKVCWQHRQEV